MSSPELEPDELATRLAEKAQEDETAVAEFAGNLRIGDAVIGFHAQQAVEKWLKAVIASRGEKYDRTHDIDRLIEVVAANGPKLPLEPMKPRLSSMPPSRAPEAAPSRPRRAV